MELIEYETNIFQNSSTILANTNNYTIILSEKVESHVLNITDVDSEEVEIYISLAEFLFCGVGVTLVALIGVTGNILSMIVLARPRLRSSVTLLLLGLTLCDTVALISLLLMQGLKALVFDYLIGISAAGNFFEVSSDYFGFAVDCAQSGSAYFTVAIALDRYIAVCWPFKSKYLCTWRRAQYVAGTVVLISIAFHAIGYIYSFPEETQEEEETRLEYLQTVCNISKESLNYNSKENSKFLDTLYENHFLRWPYLTFMIFIPFFTLIILNSFIYNEIRKVNKQRQNLTKKQASEVSFAVVCVLIVVTFIVCNSAFVVMAIVERLYICVWQKWKLILLSIDCFLVSVNAAVNCLIYCAMGENFRQQLRQILKNSMCCCCCCNCLSFFSATSNLNFS